jgi:hypothetical protein
VGIDDQIDSSSSSKRKQSKKVFMGKQTRSGAYTATAAQQGGRADMLLQGLPAL